MPTFAYAALSPDGSTVEGKVKASSTGLAKSLLAERDLHVLHVSEHRGAMQVELTRRKVKRAELMHLSRQLAAFVRAGIPLLQALETIADETTNPALRRALNSIASLVAGGDTFSQALGQHPDVFPPFYIGIVRSAEVTGHLDSVLDQVSKYIERDLEAIRKIRSALTYPAVILMLSIATVTILATFVLPRFKKFFESLNAELPLTTRMMLGVESFFAHWWWALLAVVVVSVAGFIAFIRTARGRAWRDRTVLRLPVIGETARYAIVERFCRMLSSMVRAGVPLPEAMSVSADGTNNVVYANALHIAREEMMRGDGIARPIQRTDLFPSAVSQMIRVGEDTGSLDTQLDTAAEYYEQELDHRIKKLTNLFEPAIIVAMGVMVGFVAVAMISAMYGIFQQSTLR